jgi:hypothetical protein
MTPVRGITNQRGTSDKLELVVIQHEGGNPNTIDEGERIAVVTADGHLPPEKVALALGALGITKIPVGTRITGLNEYVRIIQRAFAVDSAQTPLKFGNELDRAERFAKVAGIEIDPSLLPNVQKKYAEASEALLPVVKQELENGSFIDATVHMEMAAEFAAKGGFTSEELQLLSRCVRHLEAYDSFMRTGWSFDGPNSLDEARSLAKQLSISLEKSEHWIRSSLPLHMMFKANPKPVPAAPRARGYLFKWNW